MPSMIGMLMDGRLHTGLSNVTGMDGSGYNISRFGLDDSLSQSNDSASANSVSKNIIVPSAMFFLGALGNVVALVILTVRPSRDSKSTAFYHLVKALACMDLFGIVASSPVTLVVYINGGLLKTGGMPLCHYSSFILVMAGNATLFTVLVMAAERFMVTKYPFKYSRVVTPLAVNCSIALVWGLSTLIALLPIIGVGRNMPQWPETWCFFDYRGTAVGGIIFSYFYAIVGLLAILITMILNLTVIQQLWRMRRTRLITSSFRSSTRSSPTHNGNHGSGPDSEKRMVIFLMAIIIVFTVCYAPLMVRIIMNQLLNSDHPVPPGGLDDHIDLWALRLASLNQILDPWVYIISRVTCCKGSRDRDEDGLNHSTRSYHTVNTVHHDNTQHTDHTQHNRRNSILRTIRSVRNLFKRQKCASGESGQMTVPLQSTPTQKTPPSSVLNGVHVSIADDSDSTVALCQNGRPCNGNSEHI